MLCKQLLCSDFDVVDADTHDGDQKEVSVSGTSLTIQPSGNDQTWIVQAAIDTTFCNASVDFNDGSNGCGYFYVIL